MKIGGHLSIAGGHSNALSKTLEVGGNALQIFSSSPRQWRSFPITDEQSKAFLQKKRELQIDPIYFHASYLINLADADRIGSISIQTLVAELRLAAKMQIKGTIVHLGSFKGNTNPNYDTLLYNIKTILENTPDETLFIIENAGNRKICCDLNELAFIVSRLNSKRIKICLDTCHLHASGYDLSTVEKFDKYFHEFEKKIGLERLEVFQVNDSKDPLGSFRDRHENIGGGNIPLETFKLLVNDSRTKDIPFIIETPGFDKKGPDKMNIEILKNLRLLT